jgi:uncharacterized protein
MSVEQNRAQAIKFLQRMRECQGIDGALVTEDFQWWSPTTGYADTAKMRELVAALEPIMPRMPDITVTATTAEGDRVAIEAFGSCELTNGRRYDNTYHFLIELRDGRICRIKEYSDTKLVHDSFTL